MKVKVFSLTDKALAENDYRNILKIEIDDVEVFKVSDGEPEDSNLCRNFNDCWTIPKLMKKAYMAGVTKQHFSVNRIKVSIDEMF